MKPRPKELTNESLEFKLLRLEVKRLESELHILLDCLREFRTNQVRPFQYQVNDLITAPADIEKRSRE